MNLGWSDGGRGELRASDLDRDEVRGLLRGARGEGRLDEAEYDRRMNAVPTAKTRGDLVRMTADLPDRKNVRDWVPEMRVRGTDREDARRWLDEAAAQRRLTDEEYERRLAALSTATTYAEMKPLLEGLPGWSGTPRERHLAGTTDRDAALAALATAVADGRMGPVEAPTWEADIRQARRVGALDTLVAALAERVSDQERRDAVDALAEARRDGQLNVVEYSARADQVREAASGAELASLVADLRGDARRLTDFDRQKLADTLKRALDEGKLELAEFDERVRAAHAATTTADIVPLVADLVAPPRPARRGWGDGWFDSLVVNSALITAPRFWILKLVWKTSILTTLLIYACLAVWWDPLKTLVGGWLPLLVLLWLEGVVVQLLAGPVEERQQAVIDGLRRRLDQLRAKHPAIAEITMVYPGAVSDDDGEKEDTALLDIWKREKEKSGLVDIWVELDPAEPEAEPAPGVRDEIVGLLWNSRLPLESIRLWTKNPYGFLGSVYLTGTDAEQLRRRYGPRPYGPWGTGTEEE